MLFTSASCLLQTKAPTSSSSLLTLNLFLQLAQAREEKRVAMAPLRLSFFLYLLLLCCCSSLSIPELEKKTYIVHVAKSHMPDDFPEHRLWYEASLRSVSDTAEMLYAYDTVAHGFSARLSAAEARALQGRPGVVGVQPEVRYELHTTRTPEFLGIDREGLVPQSNAEGDVVVGVLDTGVWPERASYGDAGLGPVPASWKGACEEGKDFEAAAVCNRKLVGARFFSKGYEASMGAMDESRESSGKPLSSSPYPFIYAGNATNATNGNLCMRGTLLPEKVAGKIVLCDRGFNARAQKGFVVRDAGGAGMILTNTAAHGEELVADAYLIPTSAVGQKAGDAIKSYLFSDPSPTATIAFGGTIVGVTPSPVVAAFSSRGPSTITPDILKPDILAPGVNILAAWTGKIQIISRRPNVACDSKEIYTVSDLNYPSFSVAFETASGLGGGSPSTTTTMRHTRTLTNELNFVSAGERKSYTVSFSAASQPSGSAAFGRLQWSDRKHVVASPLAFTWT
ncbi:hypothetical protein ZIOFF_058723 [Zingiber officinale]|uniref:Subtilisin-like protease n=1 Tax=Zingiber officinale TaxID=94328 RepID=A0A8J5F8E8_ZINOF|nr:hypothetical protein ZIOFF_058723 [Zingiber officinale]